MDPGAEDVRFCRRSDPYSRAQTSRYRRRSPSPGRHNSSSNHYRNGNYHEDRYYRSRGPPNEGGAPYNARLEHSQNASREEGQGPANAAPPRESRRSRRADLSPERAASRERERRRRKMQAECIRRAGGFQKLADSEGKKPVLLFWDGFQWVAKTGASSALLSDPRMVNTTRKLRRLYFGNLPLHLGLTEANFQQQIFEEMRKRGLCTDPNENPVLCVWFAKDKGNYGFVEFASVEETERALTMDGMETLGVQIKISRPNDYCSASTNAAGAVSSAAGIAGVSAAATGSMTGVNQMIGQIADSRLLLMKRMVLEADIDSAEEYDEILEDVVEGCQSCGKVQGAILITPSIAAQDPTVDAGDVYILFSSASEADQCFQVMSQRRYFDRPIRAQKIAAEIWYNRIANHAAKKNLVHAQAGEAPN